MNKHRLTLTLCAIALAATGCTSTPSDPTAAAKKQAYEAAEARSDAQMDNVPSWYLTPPESTPATLYAVGTGFSDELSTAMRIAQHSAEYGIAQQLSGQMAGNDSSYTRSGGGTTYEQFNSVTDKLVKPVDVSGTTVEKRVVEKELSGIRVYVLLSKQKQAKLDKSDQPSRLDLEREAEKAREGLLDRIDPDLDAATSAIESTLEPTISELLPPT